MADIFISWGSPDAVHVKPLASRLRDLGFKIWEYSEDMSGGDVIHQEVLRQIDQSNLAIICLSDQSAQRQWILTEVAWCVDHMRQGPLRHLVPVKVGPLAEQGVPELIRAANLHIFDLSNPDDAAVLRLVENILKKLGRNAPYVLPAGLFAMTTAECNELFADPGLTDVLQRLCIAVGMKGPPDLFESLADRYGDTPEHLAPFKKAQPVVEIVREIVAAVNKKRAGQGRRPIFLRWMHSELVGPTRRNEARDLWRSGDSLLIVDSVSTFHPKIRTDLQDLPAPRYDERAAVLWVPPYTRHTASLEEMVHAAADIVAHIGDACTDWKQRPERFIAFDTATSVALRLWLHRALARLPDEPVPLEDNVYSMHKESAVTATLSKLLNP